ncbi:MAG: FAD-dependent oxidoreductase [Pseudomonadota bacterium]
MNSRVAVVGGGLVGATCALGLAEQGFDVTVIERNAPQLRRGRLGLELRNVALSPASQSLLAGLAAWPSDVCPAYTRMEVWEQWGGGRLHFDAAGLGRGELGWIVEQTVITEAVWSRLRGHPRVEILLAAVDLVEVLPRAARFELADGGHREFDFVVAADGARSKVREGLKLTVRHHDVHQVALATVVRTERPHQATARQRFLLDGPLALLPAQDPHVCSVVWSQSEAKASARQSLDDAAFAQELGVMSEFCLGAVEAVDERLVFPLAQQRVENIHPQARVLFVGDALRVVHPLAGLGVNLGLEDVACLLDVSARHRNLARTRIWSRYVAGRGARADAMIAMLNALRIGYAQGQPLRCWVRNLGVDLLERSAWLKHQIMREAMGLGPLAGQGRSR